MPKAITFISGDDTVGLAGIQVDQAVCRAYNYQFKSMVSAYSNQSQAKFSVLENKLSATDLQSIAVASILKIGQLPSAEFINQVLAQIIDSTQQTMVILDPVIKSSSGNSLIICKDLSTWLAAVVQNLLPVTTLVTLNHFELHHLAGQPQFTAVNYSIEILAKFAASTYFLVKGADVNKSADIIHELYYGGELIARWQVARKTGEYRGTGCLLASSIACELNSVECQNEHQYSHRNMTLAITQALCFTQQSINHAVPIDANTNKPTISSRFGEHLAVKTIQLIWCKNAT